MGTQPNLAPQDLSVSHTAKQTFLFATKFAQKSVSATTGAIAWPTQIQSFSLLREKFPEL